MDEREPWGQGCKGFIYLFLSDLTKASQSFPSQRERSAPRMDFSGLGREELPGPVAGSRPQSHHTRSHPDAVTRLLLLVSRLLLSLPDGGSGVSACAWVVALSW